MKNRLFVLIAIFFTFFSFDKVHANTATLSFSDAPTIADYKRIRGPGNLKYVLLGLAGLAVGGVAVKNWDELEEKGRSIGIGLTASEMAEFVFENTTAVAFTAFSYSLIQNALKQDYVVENKNYFDGSGFYKPLNAASIQANDGFYIDLANLFGANIAYLTSRPIANGFEVDSDGNMWMNTLELTVRSGGFSQYTPEIGFVSTPAANPLGALRVITTTPDSVTYGLTTTGTTKDLTYLKVKRGYDSIDYPIGVLTGLHIDVRVGTITKTLAGSGTLAKDVAIGTQLTFDETKPITQTGVVDGALVDDIAISTPIENVGTGEGAGSDTDVDVGSGVIGGAISGILTWLKDFFVPDFDGIQDSFSDFIDRLKDKFDFIFKLIDYIKSLFSSKKSLYDFYVVYRGERLYPFPRSWFGSFVPVVRNVANIFVFLWTCITIYKRLVGEGDVIAT